MFVLPVSTALCTYVRPSVSASFSFSAGQISTELRPLIDIRNWFSLSIFGIPLLIFFKLGMRVDIVKDLFVCFFVALRPMSTAMVIAGRSVHLTTLFPGQA